MKAKGREHFKVLKVISRERFHSIICFQRVHKLWGSCLIVGLVEGSVQYWGLKKYPSSWSHELLFQSTARR